MDTHPGVTFSIGHGYCSRLVGLVVNHTALPVPTRVFELGAGGRWRVVIQWRSRGSFRGPETRVPASSSPR